MRSQDWNVTCTRFKRPAMHEASIVDSLLRQVARKAPSGTRVHRIHVRLGRLTNISSDALNFYFAAMRKDFPGEQCELTVDRPRLCGNCQNCGAEQEFVEWTWECPGCRSGPLIFANGSELELEAIEVEDDGDHSHR